VGPDEQGVARRVAVIGGSARERAEVADALADAGWAVVATVASRAELPDPVPPDAPLVIELHGGGEGARDAAARAAVGRLTPRERQVLAALAAGGTDVVIAADLGIAVSTVRSHLERIREKTGRHRRAELTRLALEARILPELLRG
jgi:DNA-binding CsgD family transcriptional regulator